MRQSSLVLAVLVGLLLAAPGVGNAELRITDLDVFLHEHDVAVRVVVLGGVPDAFVENLQSGVPATIRFTVELWRHSRVWPDRLVTAKVVERQLDYNVVTREYRVGTVRGEARPSYATRDLRDAQRVLSEIRALPVLAAAALDPREVFYVRVLAETALRGDNTWLARWAGTAEQVARRSEYRTVSREP